MQVELQNYHPHLFIKNLAKQLGTTSKTDCLEEIIELSGKLGHGKITGFSFSDGVGFLVFNCMLNRDWMMNFTSNSPAPLMFNFDIEGEVWHTLNHGDIRYHLNPLQGSITACPTGSKQQLKLPGKRKILFTILMIDRKKYLEKIDCMADKMPEKLSNIFTDTDAKRTFFYQGNYSLSAAE